MRLTFELVSILKIDLSINKTRIIFVGISFSVYFELFVLNRGLSRNISLWETGSKTDNIFNSEFMYF
jgi:hypothetical protein